MTTLRHSFVWSVWTVIALILVISVFLAAGPFEFSDGSIEIQYQIWRCVGLTACICALFLSRIRKADDAWNITGKILAAILIPAIFVVLLGAMAFAGSMCTWFERKTLYINREDPTRRIVQREYGCGAYDSDLPEQKIFDIEVLNKCFISASEIDTTTIDQMQWERSTNR